MALRLTYGCALTVALLLAACGGDGEADSPPAGDNGGGTGTTPPPTTPPPPAPPPAPPAPGPVVANAGPDLQTVAKQAVMIDGSATRDAENDAITYAWQLVTAPAGSAVRVNAATATFEFTPDVPGTYQLRLTATDSQGKTSDTTSVIADPLLAFGEIGAFDIHPASTPGSEVRQLTVRTSANYRGGPVAITAASSAPWLRVSAAQSAASAVGGQAVNLPVQLDLAELARLPNGKYSARITITPAGGHPPLSADVPLNLVLPHVRTVVPYVAYTGQPSRVALYGDNLSVANGRTLTINGTEAPNISAPDDRHATVQLPALAAGRYTVRIKNELGIVQDMGWLVVRDAPSYVDADVPVPGYVETIELDAERDAFYGLFSDRNGNAGAYRIRYAAGTWHTEQIAVEDAGGVRLTVDGRELLVASGDCSIVHLDPETLGRLRTTTKPSCARREDDLGDVVAFADGSTFVVEEDESAKSWTYPDFKSADGLPTARRPVALLNYERNRLVWAEKPAGQSNARAWTYALGSGRTQALQQQGAPTFEITNLAISGDGRRLLHRSDLYDEDLRHLGRLAGLGDPGEIAPGLNRAGTRSVVVDATANAIIVNDLTAPSFPVIGAPIFLPHDTQDDSVVIVSPSGSTAFAFTTARLFVFTLHVLHVRAVPAS